MPNTDESYLIAGWITTMVYSDFDPPQTWGADGYDVFDSIRELLSP
jgi:hypothetical protein